MKQKLLFVLLSITMVFCTIGFAACGDETHTHVMTYYESQAATCTNDGNIEYWFCAECGKNFADEAGTQEVLNISVPAKGHSWGEWEITQQATCEIKGIQTRSCSECGASETEEIPTIEHSYGEWTTEKDATCTEEGLRIRTCSVCKQKDEQIIPKTEHIYIFKYNEDEHWKVCKVCLEETGRNAHKFIDGTCECGAKESTSGLAYKANSDLQSYSVIGIGEAVTTNMVIPSEYKGLPVTGIGPNAFKDITGLKSVYIPSTITNVGENAFSGCSGLETIYWNAVNCTEMNSGTFDGCTAIDSFVIGDDVKSLPPYCFENGNFNIIWPKDLMITEIPEGAFSGWTGSKIEIPEGITTIGYKAFANCGSLNTLILPQSVTEVNSAAFTGSNALKNVVIPAIAAEYISKENIESITITHGELPNYVFQNCDTLLSVNLLDGVTSVGDGAFSGCSKMRTIYISMTVINFEPYAFKGCTALAVHYGGDLHDWVSIKFLSTTSNPLSYANSFYCLYETIVPSNLVLPDGIEELKANVFYGFKYINTLSIPSSVKNIREDAFSNCANLNKIVYRGSVADWCEMENNLGAGSLKYSLYFGDEPATTLQIPEGVEYITANAFVNCNNIECVTLPASLKKIKQYAFDGCEKLTSIHYEGDMAGWCGIEVSYKGINNQYDLYIEGKLITEALIPSSVSVLRSYLFTCCQSITNVILEEGITEIGAYAFLNCINLQQIKLPESLITIQQSAFNGCSSLEEITIPNGVQNIASPIFENCNNLRELTLPFLYFEISSNPYEAGHIGFLFYNILNFGPLYINLETVNQYVPKTLESVTVTGTLPILEGTFANCENIHSISLPNIKTIKDNAFMGCTTLESLAVYANALTIDVFGGTSAPSSMKAVHFVSGTKVNESIFADCINLQEVIFSDEISTIAFSAFKNCVKLATIDLPQSLKTISGSAFLGCTSLTEVVIPDSVTSIGKSIFQGCTNLTSLVIPFTGERTNSTNKIFGWIFGAPNYYQQSDYVPVSLKKVELTKTTSIPNYAFCDCKNLQEIVLPDCLTKVEGSAFTGCESLIKINLPASVEEVYQYAFDNISGTIYYEGDLTDWLNMQDSEGTLTNSLQTIYFSGKELAGALEIPYGITIIRANAFRYFKKITSISIPDSVTSIGDEAFRGCSSLTSITIPDGVTNIGKSAFDDCSNIIQKENGVSYVDKWVIDYNSSVTSVTLRSDTVGIANYAFFACSSLTNIMIPSGVVSIGNHAFFDCNKFTNIYYYGSEDEWGNIDIGFYNNSLLEATRYYYSQTQPTEEGNFWHYDADGVTPVIWTKEIT